MIRKKSVLLLTLLLTSHSLYAGASEEEIQSRLSKLERMVDNRGLLNLLEEIEGLKQEVRELRGEIEQQAYTIDQMKKRQQNLYDDLDQRLQSGNGEQRDVTETRQVNQQQELEAKPPETMVQEDQPEISPVIENPEHISHRNTETSASIQPVETYVASQRRGNSQVVDSGSDSPHVTEFPKQGSDTTTGSDEESRYSEAFNLLKQGQHDKAVDRFRAFLQQYPGSQYADNAQYWLGESFYAKRKFKTAIKEYKKLLSQYPDSGKASHAQLKIGYCYDELGEKDFAQGELEDLIARYPGTSAASLAEERLALIRSQ